MTTGQLAHWDSWFHELDQHLECSTSRSMDSGRLAFVVGFYSSFTFAQHGIMGALYYFRFPWEDCIFKLLSDQDLSLRVGWICFLPVASCYYIHTLCVLSCMRSTICNAPRGSFQERRFYFYILAEATPCV